MNKKHEYVMKCFSKTTVLKNLKYVVRLIEKQVRSIEPGRGLKNFYNKISIDRKIDWINRNRQRLTKFFEKTQFFFKKKTKHILETPQSSEIDEQKA